jgi:adenosine deaminase
MPKIELHCHLDGVLDREMARAICAEIPNFPIQPEDFGHGSRVHDLQSFLTWWGIVEPLKGLALLRPVLRHHAARLKESRVVYAEIMVSAGNVPLDPMEAIETWGAFRAWTTEMTQCDLQIEFLIAFGRGKSVADVESLVDRIVPLYEAGLIVGIAMGGVERGNPARPYRRSFARCREVGMGIEIHAGEWCGPESVRDALSYGCPDRLGHGLGIFGDAALVELVRERNIHLEMCPSSNLRTGAVSRMEAHPIRKARDLGLKFSVSTDDPGPFQCTMTSEYALLEDLMGFTKADFEKIYTDALIAKFKAHRSRSGMNARPLMRP